MTGPGLLRERAAHALRGQGVLVDGDRLDWAIRGVEGRTLIGGRLTELFYSVPDPAVPVAGLVPGTLVTAAVQVAQLGLGPGQNVLVLGDTDGYLTALVAHVAGASSRVVSAVGAGGATETGLRARLRTVGCMPASPAASSAASRAETGAGAAPVDLVGVTELADGVAGRGRYERVVAARGLPGISETLRRQLDQDARLTVPLRLRGSVAELVTLEREQRGTRAVWRSVSSIACDPAWVPWTDMDSDGSRDGHAAPDDHAGVGWVRMGASGMQMPVFPELQLDPDRVASWPREKHVGPVGTGVLVTAAQLGEPLRSLRLYLAGAGAPAPVWLGGEPPAGTESLVVAIASDTGTAAAWLSPNHRSHPEAPVWEIAVTGHGPRRDTAAAGLRRAVQQWDRTYRQRTVTVEMGGRNDVRSRRGDTGTRENLVGQAGRFRIATPHRDTVVCWRTPRHTGTRSVTETQGGTGTESGTGRAVTETGR